jgi:hypothetical protein
MNFDNSRKRPTMKTAASSLAQRHDMTAAIFAALRQAENQGDSETAADLLIILRAMPEATGTTKRLI